MRGGARPGAGRPLGRKASKPPKPHKTRQEKLEAAAKSIGAAVDFLLQTGKEPFEGDAHALLVWVYKNPELPAAMRLQAAQAAAPYERPRLASIDARIDGRVTLGVVEDAGEKLAREINRLRAAAETEGAGLLRLKPPTTH